VRLPKNRHSPDWEYHRYSKIKMVIMHGESIGARVVAAPGTGLFWVCCASRIGANVMVEDIRFEPRRIERK